MLHLTVLSPHRDDAAFSLSIGLSRWVKLGTPMKIVNFFTESEYAPYALPMQAAVIPALRAREDKQALRSISPLIRMESLHLLDAPLRLHIGLDAICSTETARLQNRDETTWLASQIRRYFSRGVVMAPLGLGNHIDHLVVNHAAVTCATNQRLAFYEDLPYATWTSECALRQKVSDLEAQMRMHLTSKIIRDNSIATADKLRVISHYRSQLTRDDGRAISNFARQYHAGERIWIPKYSKAWMAFTQ